jgi:hypothetical protein
MEAPPRLLELERAGPPQLTRTCSGERGIQALWRPSARKTEPRAVPHAEGPPRRTRPVIALGDSQGGGTCTRVPPSASHCEQAPCATQIPLLRHFSSAVAAPNKSPRQTSMLIAFGSAHSIGFPLEFC